MASILIIEDDESIAELLRFMVERDGHEACSPIPARAARSAST